MMENNERTAKCVGLLGGNGTGKTTMLKRLLNTLGGRSLVVVPDIIGWEEYPLVELDCKEDYLGDGIRVHIFDDDKKKGTLTKLKYFKNGSLVFDDARAYIDASTSRPVRNLLIRRRQMMLDVFVVGHGFNEVPPVFFTFFTELILFRTSDNVARRKEFLLNADVMINAQKHVNEAAKKNPYYYKIIKFIH